MIFIPDLLCRLVWNRWGCRFSVVSFRAVAASQFLYSGVCSQCPQEFEGAVHGVIRVGSQFIV